MATLDADLRSLYESLESVGENVPLVFAVPLATPLAIVMANQYGTALTGLSAAQGVTVFGVVGGLSGIVSQAVAAEQLEKLGRPTTILELVPAGLASAAATGLAVWAFIPPGPLGRVISAFIDRIGAR